MSMDGFESVLLRRKPWQISDESMVSLRMSLSSWLSSGPRGKARNYPGLPPLILNRSTRKGVKVIRGNLLLEMLIRGDPSPAFRRVDLTMKDSLTGNPEFTPDLTKCVLLSNDLEALRVFGDPQISHNTHYHLISVRL